MSILGDDPCLGARRYFGADREKLFARWTYGVVLAHALPLNPHNNAPTVTGHYLFVN
jgi:hypothetical protein